MERGRAMGKEGEETAGGKGKSNGKEKRRERSDFILPVTS